MALLKIAATPVSAGVNGLEVARPSPSSSRRMSGTCMPDLLLLRLLGVQIP